MLNIFSFSAAFLLRFFIFSLFGISFDVHGTDATGPTSSTAKTSTNHAPMSGDAAKIEAAKKFYTKEYFPEQATRDGYLQVSSTIHTVEKKGTDEVFAGQRLIQVHIKGDGSCCFYAVGRSRTEVITAICKLIDEKHDLYMKLKAARDNLLKNLKDLKSQRDLATLKASLKQFIDDFQTEFSPPSLTTEGIKTPARHIVAEQEMEKTTLVTIDAPQTIEQQSSKPTQRQLLSNAIEGLDMNYESFVTSLIGEGVPDNWAKADNPKERLKTEVRKLFDQNQKASWMPAGLFAAIAPQLNLKVVIWKLSGSGKVSVVQSINTKPTDMCARHVLWTGGHYDILVPLIPN